MKHIAILVVGLLFGFIVGRNWPRTSDSQLAPDGLTAEESDVDQEPERSVAPTEPRPTLNSKREFVAPIEADQEPRKLDISISNQLVDDLEQDWDDLPNQVRLQRENRGWRVVYLQSGSLFSRTGLQTGDLITRESLDALDNKSDEDEQLPERVAKILGHVSSY